MFVQETPGTQIFRQSEHISIYSLKKIFLLNIMNQLNGKYTDAAT